MRMTLIGGAALALAVSAACDSSERAGSASEDLDSVTQVVFPNTTDPNASPPNHFATTSSVTVLDTSCGGTGNTYRTAVTWEEEGAGSGDQADRVYIGNECGFNPLSINNGTAVELTTAVTGVPPEWQQEFGAAPMNWGKEVTLVPVLDPTQNETIAMIGEVGPPPGIPGSCGCLYKQIAFALSFDGGQTWGNAHLLLNSPVDAPGLDDLAVAVSHHNDVSDGVYNALFNSGTLDFFLTWTESGVRELDAASYGIDPASGQWKLNHWANPLILDQVPAINPTGMSPSNIFNMSIVSGIVKSPADRYPYIMLQWPAVNDPNSSNGWDEHCDQGGTMLANQVWHGVVTYTYGQSWLRLPDAHSAAQWPTCVSMLPGTATHPNPNARNPARSALAFNFSSGAVIDAVALPDTTDPVQGTQIVSDAYTFATCCDRPLVTHGVFVSSHVSDARARQDQFLPSIGSDWWNGDVTIVYADSVDDTTNQNVPSGIYGVTTQTYSPGAPGWSAVSPAFKPSNGILGVPPYSQSGLFDVLGRHNAVSTNGWFWGTFSGDWTQFYPPPNPPIFYSSMDTVSFSPL